VERVAGGMEVTSEPAVSSRQACSFMRSLVGTRPNLSCSSGVAAGAGAASGACEAAAITFFASLSCLSLLASIFSCTNWIHKRASSGTLAISRQDIVVASEGEIAEFVSIVKLQGSAASCTTPVRVESGTDKSGGCCLLKP
jgi:hypothetical protein